jgi:hypothetical protein
VSKRLAAVLLAASLAGFAADRGFDHLVGAVESHYGIKQTHIPMMGLANLTMKLAHPGGARGLRLAIYQNLDSCDRCFDLEELDGFINQLSDGELHPLVRTHSHGEATYILTGQIGKSTKMLVATFGHNEATIVEVTVDLKTLLKTIGAPGRANDWVDGDDR